MTASFPYRGILKSSGASGSISQLDRILYYIKVNSRSEAQISLHEVNSVRLV